MKNTKRRQLWPINYGRKTIEKEVLKNVGLSFQRLIYFSSVKLSTLDSFDFDLAFNLVFKRKKLFLNLLLQSPHHPPFHSSFSSSHQSVLASLKCIYMSRLFPNSLPRSKYFTLTIYQYRLSEYGNFLGHVYSLVCACVCLSIYI